METLWLGYDGLTLPYREIVAVLLYRPALDIGIARAYGSVPPGVRTVVVTASGAYFPARWGADQIRRRWSRWRGRQEEGHGADQFYGLDGDAGGTE